MKFNIKSLFVLTSLVAGGVWLALQPQSQWLDNLIGTIIVINMIGAAVAVLLTSVFGFPTDGGYRDPKIRAENQQDESKTN